MLETKQLTQKCKELSEENSKLQFSCGKLAIDAKKLDEQNKVVCAENVKAS